MRCSICDCSNDPSISVTEECYGRIVSWDREYQRFLCDVCQEEIYFAGVTTEFVSEDLEEPEILEFEGLEGFEGSDIPAVPSEEE